MVACANAQFVANDGVLGLSYSAMAREVASVQVDSVGDGTFGELTSTGKLMVDMRLHWKSPYQCPVIVEPWYQRQRRTLQVQFGNYAYIRERYTVAVGVDSGTAILAPEPSTDPNWNTEWGGGLNAAEPLGGTYRSSVPESTCLCIFPQRLEIGQSIDVRVRATLFTQTPWAGGNTGNSAYAFANFIRLRAYPENL